MSLSKVFFCLAILVGGAMLVGCGEEAAQSPEEVTKDIQAQNKPQAEMPEHLKNRGFSGSRGPAKGGQ
jgi:hypothetical protein